MPAEDGQISDVIGGCGSQMGLLTLPATPIAVKPEMPNDPQISDPLHPRHYVLAWMHERGLKQADVVKALGMADHQKLSNFLRGGSTKVQFIYELATLVGREAPGDFDRFRRGLPSQQNQGTESVSATALCASPLISRRRTTSRRRLCRRKEESLLHENLSAQTLPLLDWWNMLANVSKSNEELTAAPTAAMLRPEEAGPRTKAVKVHDNSMDPELPLGDTAVFDPDAAYGDGDIVLVRMHDGTPAFRKYIELSDGSFDVHSTRPVQTWNSVKHGLEVLAPVICVYREMPSRAWAKHTTEGEPT